MYNKMNLSFLSKSENESFARNVIACFCLILNPSISEISDVKTAVSEAVTNAIVHGYPDTDGVIDIEAEIIDNALHIVIKDYGVGIENVSSALEPYFSSKLEDERSGMGFTIMKTFMNDVKVTSKVNVGTTVEMTKVFLR